MSVQLVSGSKQVIISTSLSDKGEIGGGRLVQGEIWVGGIFHVSS